MKKLTYLVLLFLIYSCTENIIGDHEIIDETKIKLSYYYPSDGILTKPDTLTFFVDYQIKTSEPELDGFMAYILFSSGSNEIVLRKKELPLRSGSFPVSQIITNLSKEYFGSSFNCSVSIKRIYNDKSEMIAISDPLLIKITY